MESFKKVNVVVIGHLGFHAIQKAEQDYYFVDSHFGVLHYVVGFPDMLVKSIECTICFSKSIVYLFVNLGLLPTNNIGTKPSKLPHSSRTAVKWQEAAL